MIIVLTRGSRDSSTAIFVETLAPPMTATNGFAGFSKTPPRNLISFSMRNPATPGKDLRDALRGRMGPVRGAEGVVDVHVPEEASFRANSGSFFSSSGMETDVFQEHDIARLHRLHHRFRLRADAVGGKGHLSAQELRQPLGDGARLFSLSGFLGRPRWLMRIRVEPFWSRM